MEWETKFQGSWKYLVTKRDKRIEWKGPKQKKIGKKKAHKKTGLDGWPNLKVWLWENIMGKF